MVFILRTALSLQDVLPNEALEKMNPNRSSSLRRRS